MYRPFSDKVLNFFPTTSKIKEEKNNIENKKDNIEKKNKTKIF